MSPRNGGKTWTDVTPKGLPEWSRISIIEPSHFNAGTAYIASNHYQMDDMRPYLYRTTDYGATWKLIANGIDPNEFVRVVREDPERAGLPYAGTERGVWVSFDDGAGWQALRRNLPIVPIHDLAVKEGDLIAATHGRSFWILDDLSAMRQMSPAVVAKPAHLFKPRNVYRVGFDGGGGTGAAGGHPTGQNPPSGAVVYYWLKSPNQVVKMDFLDSKGALIKSFTSIQDPVVAADSVRADTIRVARADSLKRAGVKEDSTVRSEARSEETPPEDDRPRRAPPPARVANKAGLNSFSWNLRYPDASTFQNLIMWAAGTQGPVAVPGVYSVRMTVGGQTQSQTFTVAKDPRSNITQAALNDQFAFLLAIRDKTTQANDAVKRIRNLKRQLTDRTAKMPAAQQPAFKAKADALASPVSEIEANIYQVKNQSGQDPLNYPIRLNNKIAALAGVAGSADARPTDQTREAFRILSGQLDGELSRLNTVMAALAGINADLKAAGLAPIVVTTDEPKAPATGATN